MKISNVLFCVIHAFFYFGIGLVIAFFVKFLLFETDAAIAHKVLLVMLSSPFILGCFEAGSVVLKEIET